VSAATKRPLKVRSMAASEYYQKQIEPLPPWILATTDPDVKIRLLDGTVRPGALAVFWLMTVSYLVGTWTGRPAGLVPRRIRST